MSGIKQLFSRVLTHLLCSVLWRAPGNAKMCTWLQMCWAELKNFDKYMFNVLENLRTFWEHSKNKTFALWHLTEYKQEITKARHIHCFSQNKERRNVWSLFFYVLFTTVIFLLWIYSLGADFLSMENIPKNNCDGVPVQMFLKFDPNTYSLKDISRLQE